MSIEDFTEKHRSTFEEMEEELGDPEALRLPVDLEKLSEEVADNAILKKLVDDAIASCERYTESVAAFKEFNAGTEKTKEETAIFDKTQRFSHEALIGSVNALARALGRFGKDAGWIRNFGSRGVYKSFALLTTYKSLMKMETERSSENGKE